MENARCEDVIYFKNKDVYTEMPIKEAYDETGKTPVGVRWVDVNKGDDDTSNYRSRNVAKDIRRKSDDTIFAPRPPLEALRELLSLAATPDMWMSMAPEWEGDDRLQASFIDISRAYFNARTDPSKPVYIHLPPADDDHGKGPMRQVECAHVRHQTCCRRLVLRVVGNCGS